MTHIHNKPFHAIGIAVRRGMLAAALLVSTLLTTGAANVSRPAGIQLPPGFNVETIANVFDWPTAFAFLPDGRILVAEKGGMLKMLENGVVRAQPVIDLRPHVNDYVDRGFVDVAVDPDFTRNHYIYLFYTYKPLSMPHDSPDSVMGHIERYTLEGDVVNPASIKLILGDFESTRQNHSVNSLRWSPEGYLFVSLGEGAPSIEVTDLAYRAQKLDDLHGRVLRINKEDGSGVPGNPFYDPQHPMSAQSRVWAYGMRNPFRFAVQPQTGIPYVGQVGDVTYESLFRALPGLNFGWPCVEGIIDRMDYQAKGGCNGMNLTKAAASEWDYPHMGKNASITVGDFNYGANFPASMYGDLFIGDYSVQWIKRAVLGQDGKVVRIEDFATGMGEPVDLKFGPDGMLYYLSIYSGGLRRISYQNGNHTPVIKLAAAPIQGMAPLTVNFTAAGTTDPDNNPLRYAWDFGDGSPKAQGLQTSHAYTATGRYIVKLTATNIKNAARVAEQLITVGDAAPLVSITSPGNGDVYLPGQRVDLAGTATDLLGAGLPGEQASWYVTLHDGSQTSVVTQTSGLQASFAMPKASSDNAYVEVLFGAHSAGLMTGATHLDLYYPSADGYIRTWWLSGGYPFADLGVDKLPGGQANYIVKPGDPAFQQVRTDNSTHVVNLLNYITPGYKTVAYAFIWVDVPEDRQGLLGMMSDDGIAAWLNGKPIWFNKVSRVMPDDTRDIDLPPIELKQGLNALLIKVDQNDGDWRFKVRVLNSDGSIMQDATVKTVKP